MAGETLPAGLKVCPGWTTELGGLAGKTIECGGRDYGRRGGDPAVIRHGDMCARCRKQKAKWDDEHGRRDQAEREAKERYESLIAAYVADVRAAIDDDGTPTLAFAVAEVDALKLRSEYPPHVHAGQPGWRTSHYESGVAPGHKLNVLRRLAGLPIVVPERGYR